MATPRKTKRQLINEFETARKSYLMTTIIYEAIAHDVEIFRLDNQGEDQGESTLYNEESPIGIEYDGLLDSKWGSMARQREAYHVLVTTAREITKFIGRKYRTPESTFLAIFDHMTEKPWSKESKKVLALITDLNVATI